MYLTELDVINDMLATMGEAPLNSLDEDHDLVASGLRKLRNASYREQSKAWWFNREWITLSPDVQGNLNVPNDTIRIDPTYSGTKLVQRGRRLYDPVRASYSFSAPVQCLLVRFVPFSDLPPPAATLIACAALLDFQKDYDADGNKFRQIQLDYREALVQLNAEHTRNQGANLLRRPEFVGLMQNIGPSFPQGGFTGGSAPQATTSPAPEADLGPLVDFEAVFNEALEEA